MRVSASPAPTARRRPPICSPSIFDAAGIRCGILGTVGYRIGDEVREATRTTPEAPGRAGAAARDGRPAAAAPARWKCRRTRWRCAASTASRFAAGVFTNLTRDHLDFHARHGRLLPRQAPAVRDAAARRAGLINLDDPRGAALARRRRPAGDLRDQPRRRRHAGPAVVLARRPVVRRPHAARHAARRARRWSAGRTSTTSSPRSRRRRRSTCRSTRSSAACARSTACPAASRSSPTPTTTSRVVVDYAHTDDALRNLLETARPLAHRPADHGVRLRRRSRSHQAAADGRGRRPAERSDRDHVGQPAQRGSGPDHRGDAARHHARHAGATARSGC